MADRSERDPDPFLVASPARRAALAVRFLLELALLVGVATLALQLVPEWWGWIVAALAALVVAMLWGLFLSPKASVPLPPPAAVALEALLFLGTGAGLFAFGFVLPAAIGAVAWILDRIALALLPD